MVIPPVPSPKNGLQPPAGFVDSCWTVPIIAGCMSLLVSIPQTNSGLLFVLLMDHFGVSRSTATWPKSVDLAMTNVMGFVLGAIQHRVPIHTTILAAALMCPLAILASAWVPNMTWMSVTLGFLYGASLGTIVIGTAVRIQSLFDQYRGVATGIQYLGVSLPGIIGPSLMSHLANEYGLRGTLILTAGMALNLIPLSLMLRYARPTMWFLRRFRRAQGRVVTESEITRYGTAERVDASDSFHDPIKQPEPEPVHRKLSQECADHNSSNTHVFVKADLTAKPESCSREPLENLQRSGTAHGLISQIQSVLKSPSFYVVLVAMAAADITLSLLIATIVDYAGDKGVSSELAAQLVTFLCLGGFVGRLVIPVIADRVANSRSPFTALGLALLSLCFWLMPHVGGVWTVGAVTFMAGIQQGYLNVFKPVLAADYLGVESIAVCWGLIGLATLPLLLCEPSVVGAFRDKTGSYDNLYRLCGGIDLFAASLLCARICFDAKKRRS